MIPILKKIINHFGPATLEQGIVSATSFVIGLYLIGIWSLEVFGQLALMFLIITFALEVQRAIIITPMMSLAPKMGSKNVEHYFSSLTVLNLGITLLLSVAVGAFVFFSPLKWNIASFWWAAGIFTISRLIHEYYRCRFFVRNTPFKSLAISVLRSVILIAGMLLLLLDANLEDIVGLYIISYTVTAVIAQYYAQKKEVAVETLKPTIEKHWKFGHWLIATVGVQYATNNYLILVAATILGPAIAGAIRAAQYIMGVIGTLFMALENVVPAHSAKLFHQSSFDAMARYLSKIGGGLMVVSTLFAGVIIAVSPWLIPRLFEGENYDLVATLIKGFAIFYIINSLSLCLVYALRAIENTRPIFITYTITAVLNLFLAKPIIDYFGGVGVIYGMIGFQLFVVVAYSLFLLSYKRQAT